MKPGIRPLAAALVMAVVASAGPSVFGQSLADVARKEEQRQKELKPHAKVITNDDLHGAPPASTPPPLASSPASADTSASQAKTSTEKTSDESKSADPKKDQDYWSKQMAALRQALSRDETYLEAMQSRINALTADFTARDDPAQRAVIEADRKKVLSEFDNLKKQIEADKKAIADFEEEARRAGVPPGWLRS
jgi:chromosome segregation ATPase